MQLERSYCQGPSQVKVNVDKNVVKTEKLARCGLREGHGVLHMLQMLSDRLGDASGPIVNPDSDWDPVSELKLVADWIELVKVSAFRANAFTSSMQVLMKDSIRTETLNNLDGPEETKKELRFSHFATQKVFGPLSAKFEPFVQPTSHAHRRYLLCPKGSGYNYNNYNNRNNYSNPSGFSNQQKRSANPSWNASRNNVAKQSMKAISPQEVLRKSRGGYNNQQRPFHGGRGNGKKRFQHQYQNYRK